MTYVPPPLHKKWEMPEADTGRINSGKIADAIAAARMLAAEEDDAESCLDDAGRSHEGDEFEWTPEVEAARRKWLEGAIPCNEFADARCSRCSEAEDRASILAGLDDALIDYADRIIYDDPIWTQLHAVRQALVETL